MPKRIPMFAAQIQIVFEATDIEAAGKWATEQAKKLGDVKEVCGLVSLVEVIPKKTAPKQKGALVDISSDPLWSKE